jgi:hypothetical protein
MSSNKNITYVFDQYEQILCKQSNLVAVTQKSDLQQTFEVQANIALTIVKAGAIDALTNTGTIISLRNKINANTINWSSGITFSLIYKILNSSLPKNREIPFSDNELCMLKQLVCNLLSQVFTEHENPEHPPTKETYSNISTLILFCLNAGYMDMWEQLISYMTRFIQNSKKSYAACNAITTAQKTYLKTNNINEANMISINRAIQGLVHAALILVENLQQTPYIFIEDIINLMIICNNKQITGLWEVLLKSFITLVQPGRLLKDGKLLRNVDILIETWAASLLTKNKYFQGNLSNKAIVFSSTIHEILASYVDWNNPYISKTDETINSKEFSSNNGDSDQTSVTIYIETSQLTCYLTYIKLLLTRTTQERTTVALQIERVLENHTTAPWITKFARTVYTYISQKLFKKNDYQDSGITHLLTVLNSVM